MGEDRGDLTRRNENGFHSNGPLDLLRRAVIPESMGLFPAVPLRRGIQPETFMEPGDERHKMPIRPGFGAEVRHIGVGIEA